MLKFNSANVNILKRLGTALSSLKFNGVSVWPVSLESVFTFELSASDPAIDLWLTQSVARSVTVTMDDGTVLNSSQLKAEFPYRFSSGGTHTVTVEVEDGETWTPGADFGSTNHHAFTGQIITDSATNTTLKTAVFGRGVDLSSADAFGAFSKCAGLTSVDFSGCDETTITWEVFGDCSSLTTVVWGNIQNIGNLAFHDCGFVELHIPSTIDTVAQQAFSSLSSLLRVEVAAKHVAPQAMAHCANLQYIWVRNTCLELQANAPDNQRYTTQWNGCNPDAMFCCEAASKPAAWGNLFDAYEYESGYLRYNTVWNQATEPWNVVPGETEATFVLTSNLTQNIYFTQSQANGVSIDWGDGSATETVADLSAHVSHTYAEAGTYVVSMSAGSGVTWSPGASISNYDYSFVGTYGSTKSGTAPQLQSIVFDDSVVGIGSRGFYGCTSLENVVISQGIRSVGSWAFTGCTNIKSVEFNNIEPLNVQISAFEELTNLETVIWPSSEVTLAASVFSGCRKLSLTQIPSNIIIGSGMYVFRNCTALINVEIATSLVRNTFQGCTNLEKLWLRTSISTISINLESSSVGKTGPFYNSNSNCVVYCEPASRPSGWDEGFNLYSGTVDNVLLTTIYGQTTRPW